MSKGITVTRGSGNVYKDAGFPDADVMAVKAEMVMAIAGILKDRRLTQKAAASRMGISQPDVSRLLRGHFEGFSFDRLLGFLQALGSDVEIKVKRSQDQHEGRMSLLVAS